MAPDLAIALVRFANSHDDGTPQPRAEFDPVRGLVVVRSTEIHLESRQTKVVSEEVQSLAQLRDLLGY